MWELVGLMTLWLMIIDEWLGFGGVVLVVEVLLDCLVHMIFVCYLGIWGIIVGTFICKRGIVWCRLREGRWGFTLGLGVDASKGELRKSRRTGF